MVIWQEWFFQANHWLSSLGLFSYPAFIVIYLSATLVGLPAIFLFLAAGSLFGFGPGVILVSVADTLSVAVCYQLGKTVCRKKVSEWISQRPQWSEFDRAVARKGWKIVFLTRLSPIVPSNVLNYGFSLTRIDFWQYLFVSWVAMLPVIAVYVYLASVGTNLLSGNNDPRQITASIIGIITSLMAIAYTTKLMYGTLIQKPSQSVKPRQSKLPKSPKIRAREKAKR